MAMYFIDYENVNSPGLKGIGDLNENDKVFIFYTEPGNVKSTTMTMTAHFDIMKSKAEILYFCVDCGGKNALDFQLSTYLGKCVAENKNEDFAIISNDKGFGYVSGFWKKEYNINICIINSIAKASSKIEDAKKEAEKNIENSFDESADEITDRYADVPEEFEDFNNTYNDEIIIDGMLFHDADNLPEITEESLLKADEILLAENKTEVFEIPETEVKSTEIITADNKNGNAVIELSEEQCDIICDIISKSKNKQDFHGNLCNAFGQTMGAEVYRFLKPEFDNIKTFKNNKDFNKIGNFIIKLTEKLRSFSESQTKTVYDIMENSKDKENFHNGLVNAFGNSEGKELYKLLKSEFESLKSLKK